MDAVTRDIQGGEDMSVSKWKWTPQCDEDYCVGDCDNCEKGEDE